MTDRQERARREAEAVRAAVRPGRRADPELPPMSFEQIESIVRVLERHGVDYVMIGGIAVELHGVPVERSRDLDITPSQAHDNLVRLAAALRELGARIRTNDPDGVEFEPEAGLLANLRMLNLITDHGPFDLAFQPSGTDGYDDLARNAITVRVGATTPVIADLADLVRSKSAAGRPKDLPVLELIEDFITTHRPPAGSGDGG